MLSQPSSINNDAVLAVPPKHVLLGSARSCPTHIPTANDPLILRAHDTRFRAWQWLELVIWINDSARRDRALAVALRLVVGLHVRIVGVLGAALRLREEALWVFAGFYVVIVGLSLSELLFEGRDVFGRYGEGGGFAAKHLRR